MYKFTICKRCGSHFVCRYILWLFCMPALLMQLHSCVPMRDSAFRRHYHDANRLIYENAESPEKVYLKAHMENGDVYIFDNKWFIDTLDDMVAGHGALYNYNRRKIQEGDLRVPVDSVVLFETNRMPSDRDKDRISGLTVLAVADAIFGIICISVPKACFGSCPTFYLNGDSDAHHADAEVFSNAIAPGLEYRDIDALNNPRVVDGEFRLTMKNEAFETHNIRSAKLLAVARNEGQRVYHSHDDRFYLCRGAQPPAKAEADEGDVTFLLAKKDQVERFSLADPENMVSRESIYLEFNRKELTGKEQPARLGLIAGFRQTLMTSYLIYHALDCMGNQVSDFLAGMDREPGSDVETAWGIKKALGDVDVYLWDEMLGRYVHQGGWNETGPIAFNHQLIALDEAIAGEVVKIKLELNRGLWRLDYLALTQVLEEADPIVIQASALTGNGPDPVGQLEALNHPDRYLVSMPGDVYVMNYVLPDPDQDYEMFLDATGFYLIWNRAEWTKSKDLMSLRMMRSNPGRFLKRHAVDYKQYESLMEEAFWSSRINQQIITSHEK